MGSGLTGWWVGRGALVSRPERSPGGRSRRAFLGQTSEDSAQRGRAGEEKGGGAGVSPRAADRTGWGCAASRAQLPQRLPAGRGPVAGLRARLSCLCVDHRLQGRAREPFVHTPSDLHFLPDKDPLPALGEDEGGSGWAGHSTPCTVALGVCRIGRRVDPGGTGERGDRPWGCNAAASLEAVWREVRRPAVGTHYHPRHPQC